MRYSSNKDFHAFISRLVAIGWTYRRGKKHGRITTPDGTRTLTVASSPSDHHALNNLRRDVARAVLKTAIAGGPNNDHTTNHKGLNHA